MSSPRAGSRTSCCHQASRYPSHQPTLHGPTKPSAWPTARPCQSPACAPSTSGSTIHLACWCAWQRPTARCCAPAWPYDSLPSLLGFDEPASAASTVSRAKMNTLPKPAIVTIGNFDGVHLGHQKLIHQVADRARALGLCSLAVTFEPHPEQILFPERKLNHLSTPEEKVEILHTNGMEDVWVCPFTTELARLEPEDFMRLVTERRPMAELWVGADFALGRGRRGTISVLAEIGSAMGWGLHMVPPYMLEGPVVSSTAFRTLLAAGAVRGAADLLGRPYSVSGDLQGDDLLVDPF